MTHSLMPNAGAPIIQDGTENLIDRVWYIWLNLVGQTLDEIIEGSITPEPGAGIVVGASPFAYEAEASGHVLIDGGTVTAITIERDATVYTTPLTGGFVPVGAGDIVEVTYAVLPTMTFLP